MTVIEQAAGCGQRLFRKGNHEFEVRQTGLVTALEFVPNLFNACG
jgi:hypothetical protein